MVVSGLFSGPRISTGVSAAGNRETRVLQWSGNTALSRHSMFWGMKGFNTRLISPLAPRCNQWTKRGGNKSLHKAHAPMCVAIPPIPRLSRTHSSSICVAAATSSFPVTREYGAPPVLIMSQVQKPSPVPYKTFGL